MARYERDYGRDYGWWGQGSQYGGMRSDGWGSGDWRNFAGEEGWYGEGPDGGRAGFEQPFRGGGFGGGFGGRSGWGNRGGYGSDFWGTSGGSGRGWDEGMGGMGSRDMGYGGDYQRQQGWNRGTNRGGGWGRTRASEIMTSDPQTVTPAATLAEVAKKMRDLDVGIIPVVEDAANRKLKGVITDRDIAVRAVAEGRDGNSLVSDCMTDNVRAVNKNDSVHEVMRLMRDEQIRRVPVTDREGRLVGIIAQADLAVDYAGNDDEREREVGSTLEDISRPGRPTRGSNWQSQGRAGGQPQEDGSGRTTTTRQPGGRNEENTQR